MTNTPGTLIENLAATPKDGREMVLAARAIIRDWVNSGLPYPIEELDVIVGIESQSDHVLGGTIKRVFGVSPASLTPEAEEDELADLYQFFFKRYETARETLRQRLESMTSDNSKNSRSSGQNN